MKIKKVLVLSIIPFMLNVSSLAATKTLEKETCLHKDIFSSQVLLIIPANTKVEIIEEKDGWKKVKYNDNEGWYSEKTTDNTYFTLNNSSSQIVQQTAYVERTWSVGGKTFTSSCNQGNYPTLSRPNLKFTNPTNSRINPVFADRLNELAKSLNGTLKITSGFRSIDTQISMIQDKYKTGKYTIGKGGQLIRNGNSMVGAPGHSKHQHGLAVDVSSSGLGAKIRNMSNAQLRPFGLYKPMSYENWHIQPIL